MTLAPLIALSALTAVDLPAWYSGQHAALIVVDGLGDEAVAQLEEAGPLPRTRAHFLEGGLHHHPVAALWPGRGADEARGTARSQRLSFDANDTYAAPGVEQWPATSFASFTGAEPSGLEALREALSGCTPTRLPPVLTVVHEQGYAASVSKHGRDSAEAREALAQIDKRLDAVVEAYRGCGVLSRTTFALVSPARAQRVTSTLDPETLLAPFRPRQNRRSSRLATLLETFEPVAFESRGSVLLAGPRTAGGPEASPPLAPTIDDLLKSAGLPRSRGSAIIGQLARTKGVALVVARERERSTSSSSFLIQGRAGRARLETRGDAQRYTVLSGRDPLDLGETPKILGAQTFHHAVVWRTTTADRALADSVTRVAALLDLREQTALGVVAAPTHTFDARASGAGLDGRALVLWRGAGLEGELTRAARLLDVTPTLLALVGAPLDERLEGEVIEEVVERSTPPAIQRLCRTMVTRSIAAFSTSRAHDPSVIDTSEMRRFGRPPAYFGAVRRGLLAHDAPSHLPPPEIQRQVGPRRSLLIAATTVSARVERLILTHAPNDIRRFDPLIRPELMLTGFIEDPAVRSHLRVLEGPWRRSQRRSTSQRGGEQPGQP